MQRTDLRSIWPVTRPIIGMVHLPPLPGSPRWAGSIQTIYDCAARDAAAIAAAGFDGIIVENYGDLPFFPSRVPAETIAAMTAVIARVRSESPIPIGVNVLRNDARAALAIAAATGAAFVRVNVHTGAMLTDQGWIRGRAHETLRMRARLGLRCAIMADVAVKHATLPAGLDAATSARDTWGRGMADVIIVSGTQTGSPPASDHVRSIRDAVPDAPVWIGSGISHDNLDSLVGLADGIIVGSAIKQAGRTEAPVDPERARRLVEIAHEISPAPRD